MSHRPAQPITDDPYITMAEILADLHIGRSTLYRLIEADKFPKPVHIGNRNRWRRSILENYKESLEPAK